MAEYEQIGSGMSDGEKVGVSSGKIAFFGATPVVQQTAPSALNTTTTTFDTTVAASVNSLRTALVNLGLIA